MHCIVFCEIFPSGTSCSLHSDIKLLRRLVEKPGGSSASLGPHLGSLQCTLKLCVVWSHRTQNNETVSSCRLGLLTDLQTTIVAVQRTNEIFKVSLAINYKYWDRINNQEITVYNPCAVPLQSCNGCYKLLFFFVQCLCFALPWGAL
jgi:hypothetical protein